MSATITRSTWVADRFSWDNPVEEPETVFSGYHYPANRWNGFATPAFERAEAARIMAWNEKARAADQEVQRITWDQDLDAFLLWDEDEPKPEIVSGFDIAIAGPEGLQTKHVYAVGSWAWTWMEATEHVLCDECGHADSVHGNQAECTVDGCACRLFQGDALPMSLPHKEARDLLLGLPPRTVADAQRWLESALDFLGYRFEDQRSAEARKGDAEHEDLQLVTGFHWDTDGREYRNAASKPTFSSAEADDYDANRAIAFEVLEGRRGDAYAFVGSLKPCNACRHLCYFAPATDWYSHLNPEREICFLTSEDPGAPASDLTDFDEPSSNAFVQLAQLERLIRRWHEEQCIPDEAMADAIRILQGPEAVLKFMEAQA